MSDKKNACKFTILLNEQDKLHRQVIEILNQQGRRKGQYIVNAITHYVHGSLITANADAVSHHLDYAAIERIVYQILEQRPHNPSSKPANEPNSGVFVKPPTPGYVPNASDITIGQSGHDDDIDPAAIAAIANSINAFREQ